MFASTGEVAFFLIYFLFLAALYVFTCYGLMGVFQKSGQEPAWAAFVPFWNLWIIIKLTGRPTWYIWIFVGGAVLGIIPLIGTILAIVSFVFEIFLLNSLSQSFGKEPKFTVGLVLLFPVFIWILFKGPARYLGPSVAPAGGLPQGGYPPQGYPQQGYPQQGYPQQAQQPYPQQAQPPYPPQAQPPIQPPPQAPYPQAQPPIQPPPQPPYPQAPPTDQPPQA